MFDTYKADSLKSTTRQKRRQGKDPVQYQVWDDTSIRHITMSRFLSHDQRLIWQNSWETLDYNKDFSKLVITSAAGHIGQQGRGPLSRQQPPESRYDFLESVCNRLKLEECKGDILFFWQIFLLWSLPAVCCQRRPQSPWLRVTCRSSRYGEFWDPKRQMHY